MRNLDVNSYCSPGLLEELKDECLRILSENPDDADVYHQLGSAYLYLGEVDGSVVNFGKALAHRPEERKYRISLAKALLIKTGMLSAQAENAVDAAVKNPLQDAVRELINRAKSHYTAILEQVDYPDVHKQFGDLLALEGQYLEALEQYDLALEKNPRYLEAIYRKGRLFDDNGMPEDAIKCYREVLEQGFGFGVEKVDLGNAHYSLAVLYRERGFVDEAIRHYRKVIEFHPRYADAHYHLGVALRSEGELEEASTILKKAIEINPRYRDVQKEYWDCMHELGGE